MALFVRILGTAAGGGYPQWNCACRLCRSARNPSKHSGVRRYHESVAVSVTGKNWYLINATPDVRLQIESAEVLHPGPGIRETNVKGILLTDGELDHTVGLLILREGAKLDVYASAAVQSLLMSVFPIRHVLKPYAAYRWIEVNPREPFLLDNDNLCVEAFPTGTKKPRYAGATQARGEHVIGYRLEDSNTNQTVLYAPQIESWTPELAREMAQAQCAIVDGTFWTDNEMISIGISPRTAQAMGHLPISGKTGLADKLTAFPNVRKILTHINNTNPILDELSPERMTLAGQGIEVGYDGMVLEY